MRSRWTVISIAILFALISTSASPAFAQTGPPGSHDRLYYVSVGTSLSVGVQPDPEGQNRDRTHEGYADQVYAALLPTIPQLRLQKFGCKGETTISMIAGGICAYDEGSQLAEAVSFLGAHRESVVPVTLDMGANDIEPCGSLAGIDQACVTQAFLSVAANLPYILATLRAAAGPDVPIVSMNYYNPFVAAWLLGPDGQVLAQGSAVGSSLFNALLAGIYGAFSVPVGDVAGAFHATDFTPVPGPGGGIPLNVVLVCQWTYMCVPPPQGPNIHPNVIGYGVIAGAFLPLVLP
jgi:GDSL-like Lipase/Acylhydrolase family